MRITESIRLNTALAGEATSSSRLNDLTRMASSGVKVDAPSQDPAAYARIVRADGQITLLGARQMTLDRSAGDLATADSTLSSASDLMIQAHSIALQMSNGAMSATDRAGAATQIAGIRSQLLTIANTKGANGYIFGGTKTDTPPFDATTGAFTGNDNVINVEVADGVTAAANASGAKAFTVAGGNDVFADLDNFAAALTSNNAAGIQSAIGQLDADHSQIVGAQVNVGVMTNRLTSASDVIGNSLTQVKSARAVDHDIDSPTVLSQLTATQTAYEQALAVTKQILSLSSFTQG
ncbi:MAG: flagellar hook-associated protein FlgL [Polyangiaceae bacterium]